MNGSSLNGAMEVGRVVHEVKRTAPGVTDFDEPGSSPPG